MMFYRCKIYNRFGFVIVNLGVDLFKDVVLEGISKIGFIIG